jgi:hypothetical protein
MMREWLVYVSIMVVVLIVFFRDQSLIGVIAGLLVSGPLYLGFGFVLAKFGYQRKTWRELRSESTERGRTKASRSSRRSAVHDEPTQPRPKPAPTRRTGGGSGRPGGSRKRR